MHVPCELLKSCWFLAGPTAAGKTPLGIELARRLRAEIVSMDSMAIYREMEIGTAKPTPDEREGIPHHLVDVVDPHEEFSLADYVHHSTRAVREILQRGHVPLFVGGTGLYLRGLLRGVFEGPPANWELRSSLEALSSAELHERLARVDPPTARRLHPHDRRRVIRALEVETLTARPLSAHHSQHALPEADRPRNVFWISPPRDWLYRRIDRRVDEMMARGLLEEVRRLAGRVPPVSHTARQGLGYKELFDHLAGRSSLDDAVETIKTRSRQFAKRQHTWFRNLEECREVTITGNEPPAELAQRLLEKDSP